MASAARSSRGLQAAGATAINDGTTAVGASAVLNPSKALHNDANVAELLVAGKTVTISGYPFVPIRSGDVISGIEIFFRGTSTGDTDDTGFDIDLSWDGGSSWTTAESLSPAPTDDLLYTLGGVAELWGHAWTADEILALKVRATSTEATPSDTTSSEINYLGATVYFTPSS